MSIFSHLAVDAASCSRHKAGSTDHRERETLRPRSSNSSSRTELHAVAHHRNSNVCNILPITTLRTIDLQGTKNPDRLFSRFCRERECFFEVFSAPVMVHTTCFSSVAMLRPGRRDGAALSTSSWPRSHYSWLRPALPGSSSPP